MSQRSKVLQLQPDYNVKAHDFADLAEQIVKALPSDRYEVTAAFLRGKPGPGEAVSRADRSVYFEFSDKALKGMRLRAMWRLYQFCRKEKFDVVICNRFKPVNMMLTLNRWLKVPLCIGISHGFGEYDRFYRRRQTQRLIDRHWRFVGVSPAVKQYLLDCDCGFTDQNTYAITNAIDIEQAEGLQHSRERARELLGIDPSVRLIGAGALGAGQGAHVSVAGVRCYQGQVSSHSIGDYRRRTGRVALGCRDRAPGVERSCAFARFQGERLAIRSRV
jgi:hypothetical protein